MNNDRNSDLIERYVYAVTKRLPAKQQKDVSDELNGLISDMLEERCGGVTPTDHDVRVVLTELGTPSELYAKYDPDTEQCLIGQPFYSVYKYVMKIVLIACAGGMLLAGILGETIGEADKWAAAAADGLNGMIPAVALAFGTWLGNIITVLISAFGMVTIIFAVLSRKGKALSAHSLDDLPPVPDRSKKISRVDPIVSISIGVVLTTLFLAVPQIFCIAWDTDKGLLMPVLDSDAIRGAWYLIIGFALAGIVREIFKLIDRSYTKRVMISTIVCNAVSAVLACIWLCTSNIISSDFLANTNALFTGEEAAVLAKFFGGFQFFFLGVILFALVLDTVTTVVKTMRE